MGLKLEDSEGGFPGSLWIRTNLADFQAVENDDSVRQAFITVRMTFSFVNSAAQTSSLGTPSGPGALPLDRFPAAVFNSSMEKRGLSLLTPLVIVVGDLQLSL